LLLLLLAYIKNDGWKIHNVTIEVGTKGFINKESYADFAYNLGLDNKTRKHLKNDLSKMSLRCSFVIWINRFNKNMDYSRLQKCDIPPELWFKSKSILQNGPKKIPMEKLAMPINVAGNFLLQIGTKINASAVKGSIKIPPPPLLYASFDPADALMRIKYGKSIDIVNTLISISKKEKTITHRPKVTVVKSKPSKCKMKYSSSKSKFQFISYEVPLMPVKRRKINHMKQTLADSFFSRYFPNGPGKYITRTNPYELKPMSKSAIGSNKIPLMDTFLNISREMTRFRADSKPTPPPSAGGPSPTSLSIVLPSSLDENKCGDNYVRYIIIRNQYGKEDNKFFFPMQWLKLIPYGSISNLHAGIFTAYCGVKKSFSRFVAIDHGQYPWGRNKKIGKMASLAKALNVSQDASNTCLTLHILIGLLQNMVIPYSDVVLKHGRFLYSYLNSECARDAETTVPRILASLGLVKEVCIVIIQQTIEDTFLILEKKYGCIDQIKIFIAH